MNHLKSLLILGCSIFSISVSAHEPCSLVDPNTNYEWAIQDYAASNGQFTNDWNQAIQWAKQMNASNFCGHNDWKVASIAEYRTIRNTPFIKGLTNSFPTKLPEYEDHLFWARNEINQYVASYYYLNNGAGVSGDKHSQRWSEYADIPYAGEETQFSAFLVRRDD